MSHPDWLTDHFSNITNLTAHSLPFVSVSDSFDQFSTVMQMRSIHRLFNLTDNCKHILSNLMECTNQSLKE